MFSTVSSSTERTPPPRIAWYFRLLLIVVGAGLVVLLVVAAGLSPDPRGFGTHQQLGLQPCSASVLLGIRCPSCGMTTSWAYLTHGQVVKSLQSNVGGTLLGMLAVVVGPWWLISGVWGRWFIRPPHDWIAVGVSLSVLGITLVDWTVRLWLGI